MAQWPKSVGSRPRLLRMNSSAPRADSISCKALVAPGWLKATYSAAFSKEPQSSSATSKRKCFRRNLDTMELSEGSMGISTGYGCIRTPHYAGYAFLLKVWEYLAASPSPGTSQGRAIAALSRRSEERRVGKECVRPCRSRWSREHKKNKK